MVIRVRLFALLREVAGSSRLEVEDGAAPDVGTLLDHLTSRFGPQFGRVADAGTVIVDGETVGRERKLAPGDEVAVLPPVSGGRSCPRPFRNPGPAGLVGRVVERRDELGRRDRAAQPHSGDAGADADRMGPSS